MSTRGSLIPLAIVLALAGCRDAAAPPLGMLGEVVSEPTPSPQVHILQQAPTAPPLETYQVSFWAKKGEPSLITVNYQPAPGQWVGQPFLRFYIPKTGLLAGAGSQPLSTGDSVHVTLTIDPVSFAVDFQPSGVWFSTGAPAYLTLWYQNANPDLNGDGVVDATDEALKAQLAVWYRAAKTYPWMKLSSNNDPTLPAVSTAVYHFSEYAVSW